MNNREKNLKDSIGRNENIALSCACAVIFGLILEVIFAAFFHEIPETMIDRWGPVGCDVIVAAGVAGEVWFGRKSRIDSEELTRLSEAKLTSALTDVAEANKLAAEANERVAKADLETQRLRGEFAWRQITLEQQAILKAALGELPGGSVSIWYFMNDPESQNFAFDLQAIFRMSGWRTVTVAARFLGNFAFEIRVPFREGADEPASKVIQEAFRDAGIDFMPLSLPNSTMASGDDGGDALWNPHGLVYVAPKPMPRA